MMLLQVFKWIVVGVSLMVVGCSDGADDAASFGEAPALEGQGGPSGSVGINGANPFAYHANIGALLAALDVAARDPRDVSAVNPALLLTGLLDTADGRDVFSYAARCALPAGTQLANGADLYSGGGILTTTASWLAAGLGTSQKEDVLTCMIAHLNTFGVHVPIFLSGPDVAVSATAGDDGFTVDEAIWQARLPAGQPPIYYAWPRASLMDACGLATNLSWVARTCGSPLNTCGVLVRYDQASACSGSNGSYTCNGRPAIQTTLREGDLCPLLGL